MSYIPSRKFILEYLTKREKPANSKELASELNIGKRQIKALYHRLRTMKNKGQLVLTRSQNYALPEHLNLFRGTVIGHRNGYGFLRVNGRKNDMYISPEQMKSCIHGDQVLAQLLGIDHKGRHEVRIINILVPKTSQIVGRYFTSDGINLVIPDDSRLSFDILIPQKEVMGARMGFVVVVELIKRQTSHTKAIGKIVEVLGNNIEVNMITNIALRTYEVPYIWPKLVEEEIKNLEKGIPDTVKAKRVDLRKLPLITIDDEDAKDFDDAVYCKKKKDGNWRLWVAIADVSYYVRPHTYLDKEAYNRGTSIYFPMQVVPMLPEILSNGLCSLNPQEDRLCIVCEMTISLNGCVMDYKFYEAIINSRMRFTYTKVWHILQGDIELRKKHKQLVKHIEELYDLYKILERARKNRGGISFNNEEIKFIFNTSYHINNIMQIQRNYAHKLIEECMILANISAALFVEKAKEPALFRIHDKPTGEAVSSFRFVLRELGLELSGGSKPDSLDYAKLLTSIIDRPDAEMLKTMLLRSMKQAIYDPENRGHFGLALRSYAHFTSPIRRYPDLLLHRTIKYLLARERRLNDNISNTGGYHYSMEEIIHLGQHCSMTERRADDAIRKVVDWLKCDFMLSQVGNIFKGIIINITGFGFFVRLDKIFVEGLVHISSLDKDYYYFDQIRQRLIGESSGQIYRLGDCVKVRVETVNIDEQKIDFTLLSVEKENIAL